MKTKTRILAEKVQAVTGQSLISINWLAQYFVSTGICASVEEALNYMLEIA